MLLGGFYVTLGIGEIKRRADRDFIPAFFDELIVGRVQRVLELVDIGLAHDGTGGKPRKRREAGFVGIKRGVYFGLGRRLRDTRKAGQRKRQQRY